MGDRSARPKGLGCRVLFFAVILFSLPVLALDLWDSHPDLEGGTVLLGDTSKLNPNQVTVILFWPGHNNRNASDDIKAFVRLTHNYFFADINYVLVRPKIEGGADEILSFRDAIIGQVPRTARFTVLQDPQGTIRSKWISGSTHPDTTAFVVNRDGKIAYEGPSSYLNLVVPNVHFSTWPGPVMAHVYRHVNYHRAIAKRNDLLALEIATEAVIAERDEGTWVVRRLSLLCASPDLRAEGFNYGIEVAKRNWDNAMMIARVVTLFYEEVAWSELPTPRIEALANRIVELMEGNDPSDPDERRRAVFILQAASHHFEVIVRRDIAQRLLNRAIGLLSKFAPEGEKKDLLRRLALMHPPHPELGHPPHREIEGCDGKVAGNAKKEITPPNEP